MMRKWINLFEDFEGEQKVINLPAGTFLHHGTNGDWNPAESHIHGPAWFGDEDMASDYNTVMGHDAPTVLTYRTKRVLRLLDVSRGTAAHDELQEMWDDEVPPMEMAYACHDAGYDGWFEDGGEVMIYDTANVVLSNA